VFRLKAGTSSSRHDTCRMRGRASAKHLDRFIVGVQPALNIEPFIERLGALPKPLDGNALPNLFEDRGAPFSNSAESCACGWRRIGGDPKHPSVCPVATALT
jgi:hypothetical protein